MDSEEGSALIVFYTRIDDLNLGFFEMRRRLNLDMSF